MRPSLKLLSCCKLSEIGDLIGCCHDYYEEYFLWKTVCSTLHYDSTNALIGAANASFKNVHLFHRIDTIFGSQFNTSNFLRATHAGASLIGNQKSTNYRLTITLPSISDATFSYRSYELIGSRVKGTDVAYMVWTGDLETDSVTVNKSVSFFGDATFVLLPNGNLTCSVQVGVRKFKCRPCSLVESSHEKITSCIDIYEIEEEFTDGTLPGISRNDVPPNRDYVRKLPNKVNEHNTFKKRELLDDGSVIDILILYTELSVDYYGSEDLLKADTALYVAKNNIIFSNNEIDLKIQIVGWQLTDYIETNAIEDAKNFITYDANVAGIRDEVGADLVIMFTTDSDSCSNGWLSYPFGASDEDAYAFFAVNPSCLETNGALYAVIGSAFSCDLNYENRFEDKNVEYAYAYQSTECAFHTAMAVQCDSSVLIPYYSTPSFKWSETGELLGSAEHADCSRLISENKLIVSQYRDTIVGLTVPPVSTPTGLTTLPPIPLWIQETPTVIGVLFLYTPAVVAQYGSEELAKDDVFKYVEESNKIFISNLIDLKVQVVGWEKLDYIEPNDMAETYSYITNHSGVAKLRDSVDADLVIFLTTDNDSCGYLHSPNLVDAFDEAQDFIVVRPECTAIGAILYLWGRACGCETNFNDSEKSQVISNEYENQSAECFFHTIISIPCGNSVQVPYYSNPKLRWVATGELLGSAETADCARIMNDYKRIVSAYQETVVGRTLPTAPTSVPTATKAPTPPPTSTWVKVLDTGPVPSPAPSLLFPPSSPFPFPSARSFPSSFPFPSSFLFPPSSSFSFPPSSSFSFPFTPTYTPPNQPDETSETSFSTVSIVIICVIIGFFLILGYLIWRYRTKLIICCRIPQKNNNNNFPEYAISQSVEDFPSSRNVEDQNNTSNQNVPETYDVGTSNIVSNVVVSAAWDGMRVVASNFPYIRALFGVCDGIFGLFLDYQNQDQNIRQVMNWISNIKSVLMSLEQNLRQNPQVQSILNKEQLDECKLCLENLLQLTAIHRSNQMLVQFALSTKMKELIEEASIALDSAISRLNLGVGVSMLGITLRIDENVSTLVSAVHEMKVDISAIAESINRIMKVARFPSGFSKTICDLTTSISEGGEGPVLNEQMLSEAPNALKQLEVAQDSYEHLSVRPIGIGGSARVYLVKFKGMRCAAKVVSLLEVPQDYLQDVYLKFTCELYILNLLKHPRIVELRGSISSLTEYTLLLEYMEQGSLRKVLNNPKQWNDLSPNQRHLILHDIAEGMDFLHKNKMHHRDLKSQNVLLTTDFRAKISDFGMSKTSASVTTFTRAGSRVGPAGGTLAWMAPEKFGPENIDTTRVGDKGDVYSYGIVIWEVISGIFGLESSTPWRGLADCQIINKVISGGRPKLVDGWDKEGNILGANLYMDIMQECFRVLPGDRPSFSIILQLLKNITEEKCENA